MTHITGPSTPLNSSTKKGQPLTSREIEVMDLVVLGATNLEIAARLVISHRTVEQHLNNCRYKSGIGRRVPLGIWWKEQKCLG